MKWVTQKWIAFQGRWVKDSGDRAYDFKGRVFFYFDRWYHFVIDICSILSLFVMIQLRIIFIQNLESFLDLRIPLYKLILLYTFDIFVWVYTIEFYLVCCHYSICFFFCKILHICIWCTLVWIPPPPHHHQKCLETWRGHTEISQT